MKRTNILSVIFLLVSISSVTAQDIKVPVGKKLQVVVDSKMNMSMSAMGQDIAMESSNMIAADYEFKTATSNGYSMTSTMRHMKIRTGAILGSEMSIDSENEDDRKNPAYAEAFNMLNKPIEMVFENNRLTSSGDIGNKLTQMGLPDGIGAISTFILLTPNMSLLKPGYQWKDSTNSATTNMIEEYTVTKADNNEIELQVKSSLKINTTIKQGEMEIKESMHGTVTSKRMYNKTTGILIKDESDMEMSGNTEVMDQQVPLAIKGKTTTTIS